ncbi:MAG: NAD(P)/FAD-dependent oxidoreductase [Thermoleophilia bacterium]
MAEQSAGSRVIVVGGGLVGLSSAYYLRKAGAAVTVLERGTIGGGASRFNAGEITSSVSPLPGPGIIGEVAGTIFRSDGAVYLSPGQAVRGARFFARFLRNCSQQRHESGTAAITALNRRSFPLFDELASEGIAHGMHTNGYLVCCQSQEAARVTRAHYEELPHLVAPPGPLLQGAELRAVEPALSPAMNHGFLRHEERWINPSPFVDRLADALRGLDAGIVENAEVVGLRESAQGVEVLTQAGAFRGDTAVIAAGVWSEDLCRRLGVPLGMQPGKGYSFTVGVDAVPERVLVFSDEHVVATPEGERLRIAGTMEFDGTRESLNVRRIEAMVRAVRHFLPGADWDHRADEWVAPRPMTADGLPFIGRLHDSSRILVATGHNMLGLTLAPATGAVIAALALGGDAGLDLTPFSPRRFA